MTDERMSGVLEENVLTLLCFDDQAAAVIRGVVDAKLFESRTYQEIAVHAIAFYDQYKCAIAEHLPDVLEEVLTGNDKKRATLYKRTLDNLFAARASVNQKFVLAKLGEFIHLQTLKGAFLRAYDHIEAGRIAEAEVELGKGMRAQISVFEPGTSLTDTKNSLRFFDRLEDGIPIGIKPLDDRGVQLAAGTMLLFIAPAKKGKSWGMTHIAKHAIVRRKRTLIVTLEMSEALYTQRMVQSLFSISKQQARVMLPSFRVNEQGRFVGIDLTEVERPTLKTEGIKKTIAANIKRQFKDDVPLIIKSFPTGQLTVMQLEAYLDSLERLHKFTPEVVIVDYPDLMDLGDSGDTRIDTGKVFKNLRGLCVRRNFALACPTQGNRSSATARTTRDTDVAEDYSKIATADVVITYSQTTEEKRLGLARLFVANARGDEDKFTVLITQNYGIGQFAIDAQLMHSDYWNKVEQQQGQRTDAEGEA